jgi:hypothetical protein
VKTHLHSGILGGLIAWAAVVQAADTPPIHYEVSFKDAVVATQTVTIVQSAGLTTLSAAFEADLPVFVAMHRYSEQLSATFRTDGTVERLGAVLVDGAMRTSIAGTLRPDGLLQVVRTGMDGVTTNTIARADYDFHSLILYGRAPADFLPTNHPARVLSVAEGRVRPVAIQTITESDTFERQHLVSAHLVWTDGTHISHSWHPERFSNLPRRYIRQTEGGEFTFTLLR